MINFVYQFIVKISSLKNLKQENYAQNAMSLTSDCAIQLAPNDFFTSFFKLFHFCISGLLLTNNYSIECVLVHSKFY